MYRTSTCLFINCGVVVAAAADDDDLFGVYVCVLGIFFAWVMCRLFL